MITKKVMNRRELRNLRHGEIVEITVPNSKILEEHSISFYYGIMDNSYLFLSRDKENSPSEIIGIQIVRGNIRFSEDGRLRSEGDPVISCYSIKEKEYPRWLMKEKEYRRWFYQMSEQLRQRGI